MTIMPQSHLRGSGYSLPNRGVPWETVVLLSLHLGEPWLTVHNRAQLGSGYGCFKLFKTSVANRALTTVFS